MQDALRSESHVNPPIDGGRRLEVWGDPIDHSRSPHLHGAAHRALGLDWSFDRRRVDRAGLDAALASLNGEWRGLALTMPLKEGAFAAARTRDRHAELTGAVNTLLFAGDGSATRPRGFNTDVGGIVRAMDEAGLDGAERVRILGAGATAGSALVAAAESGARRVQVVARRAERAAALVELGERAGVRVDAAAFDAVTGAADVTIATLPGGADLPAEHLVRLAGTGGTLFDVAYDPWPSALARRWEADVVPGLGMLLHQAVLQVRIFVSGERGEPLQGEDAVLEAMRKALSGPR
ncbi:MULTISPECIES: shikimate dehydrogenase family protein [unclassified Microbacterium]|uniref:shikimate dehydrogenase family protein n=1 Tax=unclassified Microbacterium TaxID=2609290 RepID=UPI00097E9E85|nr:shikimate dehydrogenase [Microbacterium sp. JB110]RCS62904.1 shikimate dehydrogenase [Microbacterium sp. JB110]SJM61613.1 Shikimate 5-dehydrogenase I alpha [Frigoribacterium sp. JB110]